VRWRPAGGDHGATSFDVGSLRHGGNPTVHDDVYGGSANMNAGNLFNSPDGMMIDTTGLIWIQTDGNDSNEGDFAGMGNNQMLAGDPVTGEIRRFLTGPNGCEVTGLTWSSDRRTMFVGIQHPGDNGGLAGSTARCAVGHRRGHAGRRRPRRLTPDFGVFGGRCVCAAPLSWAGRGGAGRFAPTAALSIRICMRFMPIMGINQTYRHGLNRTQFHSSSGRSDMPAVTTSTFRLAGLLYLVIIVLGISSEVLLRGPLTASGDAMTVAAAISANPTPLRLSIAADAIMAMSDAALAVLLFFILRTYGTGIALAAMVFRLMQGAVIAASLLLLLAALRPEFSGHALSLIEMHGLGYDLGLVFFGVNSILTGMLLCRVGGATRVIAGGIMLSGLVYITGSALRLADPAFSQAFAPAYGIPVLAESAFCLWLLIAGAGARRVLQAA
jgi:hypothetical protein